jgi:hypothetical protein
MQWADLNDPINGMHDVLILMSVEWMILLAVAFFVGSQIYMAASVSLWISVKKTFVVI